MSIKGGVNMPGMNHMGPYGQGAMTGRRMGRCNVKNNSEMLYGRRHLRGRFHNELNSNDSLVEEKRILQERINEIDKILADN